MCVVRVLTLTCQYPLKAANPIIHFLLPSNLSAFLPYFIIFILGFLFFLRLFLFFTFHSCLLFFCHTLFICPFLLSHIYTLSFTLSLSPPLSLSLSLSLSYSLFLSLTQMSLCGRSEPDLFAPQMSHRRYASKFVYFETPHFIYFSSFFMIIYFYLFICLRSMPSSAP